MLYQWIVERETICFSKKKKGNNGRKWEFQVMRQGFPATFLLKQTHPRKGTTKYLQKIGLKNEWVSGTLGRQEMCGMQVMPWLEGNLGTPTTYMILNGDFSNSDVELISQTVGNWHGNLKDWMVVPMGPESLPIGSGNIGQHLSSCKAYPLIQLDPDDPDAMGHSWCWTIREQFQSPSNCINTPTGPQGPQNEYTHPGSSRVYRWPNVAKHPISVSHTCTAIQDGWTIFDVRHLVGCGWAQLPNQHSKIFQDANVPRTAMTVVLLSIEVSIRNRIQSKFLADSGWCSTRQLGR